MKVNSAVSKLKPILLLFLLAIAVFPLFSTVVSHGFYLKAGGGGGVVGSAFSLTYTTPGETAVKAVTYNGSTLDSATWADTSYVSVEGSALQILPDEEYISNNGSFTISGLDEVGINVTFEVPSGYGYFGQFVIAYGVNVEPYILPPKLYPSDDGIVLYIDHADTQSEVLIGLMNGVVVLNETINTLSAGTEYTIGFVYGADYEMTVYWYNGSWYKWTTGDVVETSTGYKDEPVTFNGNYFVVGASNAGPGFGYGEWEVVSYEVEQSVEVLPPMKLTLSYYATTLSNGVNALDAFVGAYNPVNVTTNASSWSVTAVPKITNYSVSGSVYPVSGHLSYVATSSQILLITDTETAPTVASWYLNETFTIQLVSSSSSYSLNVTIPVLVVGFAEESEINYPQGSYLSGQVVCVTNTTTVNLPTGEGYTVAQPIEAEIDIESVTPGYVPLPFSKTFSVSVTTTYIYYILVEEGGIEVISFTDSFTVYPVQNYPVIFAVAPSSATLGSSITVRFEFTENAPIANISSFVNGAGNFHFSFWQIKASSVEMILDLSQVKYGALVFIPSSGTNIYVWFNGSSGLDFSVGDNLLTLTITSGVADLELGGLSIDLDNTTPLVGVGIYNSSFNWLYVDGAVLQNAYAGQSYVISIGNSTATLTQYVSGYTNASGWGVVSVPVKYSPYELINIYWYGVKNLLLNISVTVPSTSTSTTVNTSTLSYNYTEPFSNHLPPTATLYNFSNVQPWATIVGLVVLAVITLLGWKFGNVAGASGGAVAGTVLTSYLGLLPWYLYFVLILAIAMLLAKLLADRFMGGESL